MPYEPIPYAPDEVYSSRDYTRQQMALLQQQADREGAYAQRRGALMADRWKGLGGLATETLASLVQSRDLRDAKAEAQRRSDVEQARYGTEQARLDRAESDRTRAFEADRERYLTEDEWRRKQIERAERLRQYGQLTERDQSIPFSAEDKTLWDEFNPTSPSSRQLSPATTPAPPRDIGDAAIGRVTFGPQAQPRVGADVFGVGGVTFGGPPQTLAGVSRRQPLFPSTPPPPAQGPTEFRRPRTAAEARAEQALVLAGTRRDEDIARQAKQDVIEAAARKQAQSNADRAFNLQAGNQIFARATEARERIAKRDAIDAQIGMVLQHPSSYLNLPLATQAVIGPELANRGFTGFGKPMSDSALTSIAESKAAMRGLEELRSLVFDNQDKLGPVVGFAALNPYSKAREIQANLDLTKQKVGKLLEGGVLREYDEEKYKKILSTLYDQPDLALYKIDSMIRQLERDFEAFSDAQLLGGRRPMDPSPTPPPAPSVDLRGEVNKRMNRNFPPPKPLGGNQPRNGATQ